MHSWIGSGACCHVAPLRRAASSVLVFVVSAAVVGQLGGCSAGTEFGTSAPTNTPDYYPENKPFYLEDLKPDAQHKAGARELRHLYEFDPEDKDLKSRVIKDGSPLSVIVGGVRVPADLPGERRDLAVVLDVATSATDEPQSMVVFYQRAVRPGQMLNFQNLLVYYDPQWDSTTPPYFRLRMIDVYTERNSRVRSMLDRVGSLGAAVNGLIPHPIMPIVTTAIEAARLVLGNRENKTLLDYQVQFYSLRQVKKSGGADLGVMREGTWLVLGRPRGNVAKPWEPRPVPAPRAGTQVSMGKGWEKLEEDRQEADVWRERLALDRRTDQVLRVADGRVVDMPYVSVTVTSADAQVPKFVMDRTAELVKLLSSPAGKADSSALEGAMKSLEQSVSAFTLKRRIQRDRYIGDVKDLVETLGRDLDAQKLNQPRVLNDTQVREMMRFLERTLHLENRQFATVDQLQTWWNETGFSGRLVEDETAPLGVKWASP